MNDHSLEQLRANILVPIVGHKVIADKRLKAEILLMRSYAIIVEDKPGSFICEGNYGRGVANHPDGHFKFPHLWPVKFPQAGRPNYQLFGMPGFGFLSW